MTETWLPIPGFEGLYSVSDGGRVRSERRVVMRGNGAPQRVNGQILTPIRQESGHLKVVLNRRGDRLRRGIHQFVLSAFVGPCPSGMESLHIDDDPANNVLTNLRYGTRSENISDRVRNGRHRQASQTHCIHGHEFTPENTYTRNRPGGGRKCKACNRRKSLGGEAA